MLKDSKAFSSFSVDDLEKAKDFYQNTLGLDVQEIPMGPGLLELHLTGGGVVMIYPKPNHEPASFTVLNFPVEKVEETVDELTAKGIKFLQYDMEHLKTDEKGIARGGGGPDIAWFTDPAGNIIGVMTRN